jgi:O-antigen/teichoic acid export membrane protein
MGIVKKLASDTAWYGLSSIVGRLINYLLVPFYATRGILSPQDFGSVRELMAYVAFFNIIYTVGMETAYFRFSSKKENLLKENNIASQANITIFSVSTLVSVFLFLFSDSIAAALGYAGKGNYITWISLIMLFDAIVAIPFAQLRLQKKPKQFAFAKLANIFINVFLNFFFLWFLPLMANQPNWGNLHSFAKNIYNPNFKVGYILLANLISSASLLVWFWKPLLQTQFKLDKKLFSEMFLYAYPLIFMGLAGQFNNLADNFFIKYYLPKGFYPHSNLYMLGVYNACAKFAIFMVLVVQAYRYAAEPLFFSKSEDKNAPELFAEAMKWFVIAGCVMILGISFNIFWLKNILIPNPEYHLGLEIVPYLLSANLFLGIYFNLTIWFKLTHKTQYGTYITLFGVLITAICNLSLVPILGILGCAVASLITYFSMCILCYIWGQKFFKVPYNLKESIVYLTITIFLSIVFTKISIENLWLKFLFLNGIILTFIATIYIYEKKIKI